MTPDTIALMFASIGVGGALLRVGMAVGKLQTTVDNLAVQVDHSTRQINRVRDAVGLKADDT